MVQAVDYERSTHNSRSSSHSNELPGRQDRSQLLNDDKKAVQPKVGSRLADCKYLGNPLNRKKDPSKAKVDSKNMGKLPTPGNNSQSDMEMMKEKFAKLLLGEDMSGGGKGVSSALALSNAITNLAASVFGAQKKLEPMPLERKTRWKKEIDWLLSVTDHIVELVPSSQQSKDGVDMEIMVTRQRSDLLMNIPALRKLDAILIDHLDHCGNQNEFWYGSKKDNDPSEETPARNEDKWWIPTVKVSPNGLSESTRRWLQFQKDSVTQVLKAAMAINAQVLSEIEIPENYIESLPKNGRESLGDSIYKCITDDNFNPDQVLSSVDLSVEHNIVDLKNRIEASIIIWKRKLHHKDKSAWGSAVSTEKRELFEDRAEMMLILLKQRFPGIAQSQLDISKIQYNKDVGQAILESYSRVIESLAYTILSRIEDVLHADSLVPGLDTEPKIHPEDKMDDSSRTSEVTLYDIMGWDQGSEVNMSSMRKSLDEKATIKMIQLPKKLSYLERLESLGSRSPASRH